MPVSETLHKRRGRAGMVKFSSKWLLLVLSSLALRLLALPPERVGLFRPDTKEGRCCPSLIVSL